MKQDLHDWIENYTDYEAVLVCQNELHPWDSGGVIRAFQTYGWEDGSTPGNNSTFVHELSGVVVSYDGGYTAIDFCHGELSEAFADLFSVLYALGWRTAHVYHPPETMIALLADMGRAIPANMDFDIQAAPGLTNIKAIAEGASLLNRAYVSPSGMEKAEQTVLSELRSMEATTTISLPPSSIILEDDEDHHDALSDEVIPIAGQSILAEPDFYSETPIPVSLPKSGSDSDTEFNPQQVQHTHVDRSPNSDQTNRGTVNAAGSKISRELIHVGNSIFCFDSPSPQSRITENEIQAIANELGVYNKQFVSIRLGQSNNQWHWDLLGEIPQDNLSFAEKLVDLMEFNCEDKALIAIFLAAIKKDKTNAELRDLLNITQADEDECNRLLALISGSACNLLNGRVDLSEITTAIYQRLGPFVLIPQGVSFFDVTHVSQQVQSFTCLDLMQSPERRLFLIQVDELDAPFIHWAANLLRSLVTLYAKTSHYSFVEPSLPNAPSFSPADINKVRQEGTQEAFEKVSELFGGMMQQFNALKISTEQTLKVD